MRNKDYRNSKQETPAENGVYDWRVCDGVEVRIDYKNGVWTTKAGDVMADNMQIWWR